MTDETQVNTTAAPAAEASTLQGKRNRWIGGVVAVVAAVIVYNLTVWMPASNAIRADSRNSGLGIHVYRTWLVHPRDITVDLASADGVATIDLTRSLFQSAEALKDREFGQVSLARQGKTVFVMKGSDFAELGQEYAAGQNPIYLVRTLPEKIYRPDGSPAFGTWTGGWLGVLGRQMDDVNGFGQAWVSGEAPGPVY